MIEKSIYEAEKGDYVKCITDRLKFYKKGSIYKVHSRLYNRGNVKLKMEGFDFPISYTNFELISDSDVRKNKLEVLNGSLSKINVEKTPLSERKIDLVEDKDYVAFELILNRISRDKNKLQYNKNDMGKEFYNDFNEMIETIVKGDKIYGANKEDFENVSNMKLSEILGMFIKIRRKNFLK